MWTLRVVGQFSFYQLIFRSFSCLANFEVTFHVYFIEMRWNKKSRQFDGSFSWEWRLSFPESNKFSKNSQKNFRNTIRKKLYLTGLTSFSLDNFDITRIILLEKIRENTTGFHYLLNIFDFTKKKVQMYLTILISQITWLKIGTSLASMGWGGGSGTASDSSFLTISFLVAFWAILFAAIKAGVKRGDKALTTEAAEGNNEGSLEGCTSS